MTELEGRDHPVAALVEAISLVASYVPDAVAAGVADLSVRAGERLGLGTDLTVVALAGSTGSGKSTLLNALAGLELAETGVRRPTTSQPMACVWGDVDADAMLDWLDVPAGRRVRHQSLLDDGPDRMHGLVLLDLPDHDSLVQQHRDQVDRLVGLVDVLVWVTDPVKYADALLHEEYLRTLNRHGAVVTVVLNQVDRLSEHDQQLCLADLSRLTEHDGLAEVRVLPVSAATGSGLADLVSPLESVVASRQAAHQRLAADAASLADHLRAAVGAGEAPADIAGRSVEDLVEESAGALALDEVLDRVEVEQRTRAEAALRWPWVRSTAADAERSSSGLTVRLDALLGRKVGRATPSLSAADVLHQHIATESAALPPVWAESVREQLTARASAMATEWERAVAAAAAYQPEPPGSWERNRRGQWLCVALAAMSAVTVAVLVTMLLVGSGPPAWRWALAGATAAAAIAGGIALNRRAAREPDAWARDVMAREHARLRALVSDGVIEIDAALEAERASWRRAAEALDRASG